MNNYTVFDTETTGLPPTDSNWRFDYMEFPYIVQLAWKRSDSDKIENHIIQPNGWDIPEESTKIHGITHDFAMKSGEDMATILELFMFDLINECDIIGHNVHFDTSMVAANYLRLASLKRIRDINIYIEFLENRLAKDKRICTMWKSNRFCGLKQVDSNKPKTPSLVELYDILFGESFPAHNAAEDTRATERCYLKLIELGII